jgi:hypothetical protein
MNDIDRFVNVNYTHLLKSANNIINKNGSNDDPYELLNYSILQLLEHHKREDIIKSGFGVFWLIRVMTNSIFSNTSAYHKQIRGSNLVPIDTDMPDVVVDTEMKENLLNQIETILNEIEKQDISGWYMVNVFRLWVEKRNYYAIVRETNIPRTSITRAVKSCKELVLKELKKRNIDYEL